MQNMRKIAIVDSLRLFIVFPGIRAICMLSDDPLYGLELF